MGLVSEMLVILLLLWLICLPSASASGYIHVHEVIMQQTIALRQELSGCRRPEVGGDSAIPAGATL